MEANLRKNISLLESHANPATCKIAGCEASFAKMAA